MLDTPPNSERRDFLQKGLALGTAAGVGTLIPTASVSEEVPPVRESIETLDPLKLEKVEAAIKEMMDRSAMNPNDPKGWLANAEPHNAFCAAPGTSGVSQIHFCYWFLPWHRAYLAMTERKIREIASDSTLAFPYWNWSANRRIPIRFSDPNSPLSKAVRFTPDRDLEPDEVDYIDSDPDLRKLGVAALAAKKFLAIPTADPIQLARELRNSFGGLPRPNLAGRYGNSRLEGTPHGPVHVYVGGIDDATGAAGDMTDFGTAGRDPIFFAHHGNLDRIWEKWRSNPANRATEPQDNFFLDRKFIFPWLDGSTIEISCADAMDTSKLGYTYDSLEVLGVSGFAVATKEGANQKLKLSPILNETLSKPLTPEGFGGSARYILVLSGLESPGRPLSAGVFVSAAGTGDSSAILVGSISVVQSGNAYLLPNETMYFDVTSAVITLGTPKLLIQVIPNQIGGEAKRPYQPIRYKSINIIRE
ncbi:tyrosinase family protein [Methyloversatilis sp. XJ19-13]|uniref:tyrosinase family protein n=1 Tax=Methyloversatilis sp. XJ19-13 TaxID=2963430 RepID=UPI00211BD178|nr:tyrosinase family protein [Methyloversatilis sp. XJ19-13]MCQ9376300.1 tyrosinase family protein [Methyloversatilis sp. XJ19-13]